MTTLDEPCPGNDRGAHIIPVGVWNCVFCGAEKEGEEFYTQTGKYRMDKDGCTRIGDVPEDVRRYNEQEFARLRTMLNEE